MSSSKRISNAFGNPVQGIKKKNENLVAKHLNIDYENENINPAASTRRYSTRRNCQKETFNMDNTNIEEMKYGDAEFTLSLKKYLGEAINENEKLREKILLLKDEIEAKDEAISELAEFYMNCQKHHQPNSDLNTSPEISTTSISNTYPIKSTSLKPRKGSKS